MHLSSLKLGPQYVKGFQKLRLLISSVWGLIGGLWLDSCLWFVSRALVSLLQINTRFGSSRTRTACTPSMWSSTAATWWAARSRCAWASPARRATPPWSRPTDPAWRAAPRVTPLLQTACTWAWGCTEPISRHTFTRLHLLRQLN